MNSVTQLYFQSSPPMTSKASYSHRSLYSCFYRVPCALGLHVPTLSVGYKPGWGVTSSKTLLRERKTVQYRMNSNSFCQTWEDIYRAGWTEWYMVVNNAKETKTDDGQTDESQNLSVKVQEWEKKGKKGWRFWFESERVLWGLFTTETERVNVLPTAIPRR